MPTGTVSSRRVHERAASRPAVVPVMSFGPPGGCRSRTTDAFASRRLAKVEEPSDEQPEPDYRFLLASERTFLAHI